MTISTAASPLSYAGDGSTVDAAITWAYKAKSHVVATLRASDGTETIWVLDTDYTLTDAGSTGTLTATTAWATGETLVITSEPPNTQETDIPLGGSFPAKSVEDALDLASQVSQKIQTLFDRALRVPKTDTRSASQLELPNETDRASKFLGFNTDGDPTATDIATLGALAVPVTHENGGLEFDASAVVDNDFIVGSGTGTFALESAATAFATIKQAATASATGVVELATQAEVNTGSDTVRSITPKTLDGLITGKMDIAITAADEIIYADVTDSNNPKKDTVQGILDLGLSFSSGMVMLTYAVVAESGWVLMDDGSIGSAASGATTRANADTETLFKLLWDNTNDAECPVSGGRGASAQADFDADKNLTIPLVLGRALAITGSGSGLTARTHADTVGEENHTMTTAELKSHNHSYTRPNTTTSNVAGGASGDVTTVTGTNTGSVGSTSPFNVMQPTTFLNVMIKL